MGVCFACVVLKSRNSVLSASRPWAEKLSRSRCHRLILSFRAPVISRSVSSPETETHQSPIWLKADGERPSLRPLAHRQPQKIFGTKPCPSDSVTDRWFPVWARGQTLAGSRPGRFRSHSSDFTGEELDGTVSNQVWWLLTNPNGWFAVPAIVSDQSTSPPQRELGHASRNSRLGPTCGLPPLAPPR